MKIRHWIIVLVGIGITALVWPLIHTPAVRIIYNPSDSMPRGWYRISTTDPLRVGSIVLAQLPADAAALAAQRGYLPMGIPLLKRIGAMAPQQVCIEKQIVSIDGAAVGEVRTTDGQGR